MQRNTSIDIAKGLGILLVVAGHNKVFQQTGPVRDVIYSFHMPLFFFLTGVLLKERGGFLKLAASRADALLKPYLTVLLAFGLSQALDGSVTRYYFWGVAHATGRTIAWQFLPMWFLPHLFLTTLLAYGIIRLSSLAGSRKTPLLATIAAGMLVWGGTTLDRFQQDRVIGLPFSTDLAWVTASCTLFGFLLKDMVAVMRFDAVRFVLAAAAFACLNAVPGEPIDLNGRHFGLWPVTVLQSVFGIFLTLSLSCAPIAQQSRLLRHLGAGSLFILMFHEFFQTALLTAFQARGGAWMTSGIAAFVLSITASLALLAVVQRSRPLALLLLPRRRNTPAPASPSSPVQSA